MAFDPSSPGLRASDADREATADKLRLATTEGRLDPDELDERLSVAYGARYCAELTELTADVTPPPPPPPPVVAAPRFVQAPQRTNGLAVASLVCALPWMWGVGSVAAIIFGHLALHQIAHSGGLQRGRSAAMAGLVLGYLGILAVVLAVVGGIVF
jgi:hypothetical protein